MNELSLFAGGGGGILGGRLLGWRTVCAVEKDPYCQAVLLARQADGILEHFPIWDDVQTFDGSDWRGKVDVITAGFPCQPFSVAGIGKGKDDARNMWPSTIRIICEVGCPRVLLENVPGLINQGYFGEILGNLADGGYDAVWGVLPSSAFGCFHSRRRLWIYAYTDSNMPQRVEHWGEKVQRINKSNTVFHTQELWDGTKDGLPFPAVLGTGNGLAFRVDRTKAIGNGQVPVVAANAWRRLTGIA